MGLRQISRYQGRIISLRLALLASLYLSVAAPAVMQPRAGAGPLSFQVECLSSDLADSLYDMPHAVRADGVLPLASSTARARG